MNAGVVLARLADAEVDDVDPARGRRGLGLVQRGRRGRGASPPGPGSRAAQEALQHAVGVARATRRRRARRGVCAWAGSPGPKFTASTPAAANSATGVHACLASRRRSPAARRRPTSGLAVATGALGALESTTARRAGRTAVQPRLGLRRLAARGVAEVDVRRAAVRDDVLGDPARDLRHGDDLGEGQPVEARAAGARRRRGRRCRGRRGGSRCRPATAAPSGRCGRGTSRWR